MTSPTMHQYNCESIEEISNYENDWLAKIAKHHISLNMNLNLLLNEIKNNEKHLSLIKKNVSKQHTSMLSFSNNKSATNNKHLALLSDELDCLKSKQLMLLDSEKEFRQICLKKHNDTLKRYVQELTEQINFYELALNNLKKNNHLYVISEDIFRDNKNHNEHSNKNRVEGDFLKISQKVRGAIQEKLTSDQKEIEKRKKIIDRLQKQQNDLQKIFESYTKKLAILESHYKGKIYNLQSAIECTKTSIKMLDKRRLLDAEGFLSDIKLLCEQTLKIQRQIKDPVLKKQMEIAVQDIQTSLEDAKGKIIDLYKT